MIASPNAEKVFINRAVPEFLVVDTALHTYEAKNEIVTSSLWRLHFQLIRNRRAYLDLGQGVVWDVFETTGIHIAISHFSTKKRAP